jgi:hypothetical protein
MKNIKIIGNGLDTSFLVRHNLKTKDVGVVVRDDFDGRFVSPDIYVRNENEVELKPICLCLYEWNIFLLLALDVALVV